MSGIVHIGYTGTRDGMSEPQHGVIKKLLGACVAPVTGHHGDCVGGDAEFHAICKDLGFRTVLHLPVDPAHRAFCVADEYRDPLTYLKRNREIVHECRIMFAAPPTMEELSRGGTWYTVRYTRKFHVPTFLWVVLPDGTLQHTRTEGRGALVAREL